MTTIAAALNSQQIAAAKSAAEAITESAKAVVSDKRFVFLAAFDGTNNDRNAIYKSGSPLDTNVAQLEDQIRKVGPPSFSVEPNDQNRRSSSSPVGMWAQAAFEPVHMSTGRLPGARI